MVMLVEGSTVLTMDGRCADVSQLTMINVINEGREKKKKDTVHYSNIEKYRGVYGEPRAMREAV
jgi:hypothetical protein